MSELPKHWREIPLGDFAQVQGGSQPPKKVFVFEPKHGFVRLLQIRDFGNKPVPTYVPENRVTKFCKRDDVLIARYGASLGRIVTGMEGAYNVALAKVIADPAVIERRYLFYMLQTPTFQTPLHMISRSAQNGFNTGEIYPIRFPIAPLAEQRRIVARIEELFSRLDAGVAALRHAKAQLQRYRQSVLTAAVTGQLTQAWRDQHPDTKPAEELLSRVLIERQAKWAGRGKYPPPVEVEDGLSPLPQVWTWTTLAHLANHIADGTHKTPTYVEEGIPFLSAKDVNGFKLSFDNCRFIPLEEHEDLIQRCCPKPGNVLVTKSGTIGRIAVVKTDLEFSLFESVANVPVISPLCSDFIAYASHVGISGAFGAKNKKGVAVRHLHLEDLRRLPVPLPPLAEQHRIVAEVEARTTAIDHLEVELDRQITRSNRLRQSTLAAAFSGNLNQPLQNDGL